MEVESCMNSGVLIILNLLYIVEVSPRKGFSVLLQLKFALQAPL